MTAYNSEFKEQAIQKLLQRGTRTIQSVADELNVNIGTLKYWLKSYRRVNSMNDGIESTQKRPQDWSPAQRLQALMESHLLSASDLSAYCRENGIFQHHLDTWKTEFTKRHASVAKKTSDKVLRSENNRLKKELNRKERALAETAALLVLQKKFNSLWEGEEC